MLKIIENVRFMQDGTMAFGDLYFVDGYLQRIEYKTPVPHSDLVVSGFIDMHTHGFLGYRCDTVDEEELKALAKAYTKRGVTGFCPTISSRPLSEYAKIFDVYRKVFQGDYKGAVFLGFHMEGPYLNQEKAGAVSVEQLQSIDLLALEQFLNKYGDMIRVMSIAPELANGFEAIAMLRRYGIQVSFAHTACTYSQAKQAIACGVNRATHLCNGMPEISHREAGLIDAIIESDMVCEMIMDGVHIQPSMLRWLLRLLDKKRIVAVSDGTRYCGYEDCAVCEDPHVQIVDGVCYQNGVLAGGTKDLLHTFQYLYFIEEYDLDTCMRITGRNAADSLSLMTHECKLGKRLDFIVFDHHLKIKEVVINGRSYSAE